MNDKLPPPQNVSTTSEVPDYYLGCLLYRDDDSDDNCRWVVYDGRQKVRCPTRSAAIDYITAMKLDTSEELTRKVLSARLHLNHSINDLRDAVKLATGPQKLIYEQTSARLRPYLVDLDNFLLKDIPK